MHIKKFLQNFLYFIVALFLEIQKTQSFQLPLEINSKSIEENFDLFFEEISKKSQNKNLKFLKEKENKETNILTNYFSKEEFKNLFFDLKIILENLEGKKIKENSQNSKSQMPLLTMREVSVPLVGGWIKL